MSRLFIELYLDEDVSVFIAELLRVRGFTAQTTQEAGRKKTDDEAQLAYAVSQQRAVLTHNRDDFARLAQEYFAAGRERYGIVITYYGNQQQLEYDFTIAPGADPKAIALSIQGAEKLEIDNQGVWRRFQRHLPDENKPSGFGARLFNLSGRQWR